VLLSDRDIKTEIESGRVKLDPYEPELIQPSSIDVRLDRYFRVFENHRYPHIDPAVEQPDLTRLVETEGEDPFVLHPNEFVLASTYEVVTLPDDIAGRLEGKALAIDTPIPTPRGWRPMGDLRIGEEVFDEIGRPTPVVAATGIMVNRACAEVVFSDGQSIVADLAHRWLTRSKSERKHLRPGTVRSTKEIANSLRAGNEWNHHVQLAGAARYPEQPLPIDPYVLGIWLGDGTASKAEAEAMGLFRNKHVPEIYLRAAINQRIALLQGLMDSDGYMDINGRCAFCNINESLADAVVELAASLGLRPVKRKKRVTLNGIEQTPAFQVKFTPRFQVFRLRRKASRLNAGPAHTFRSIVDVRECEPRPVRCIQVANPTGLFLAGPTFIPTHNSSLGRLGLLTHSTAGWIDPGFSGHVTLELSNVATLPIKLWPGMKIGQLCLFRTSSPAEHPYGSPVYGSRYQDQRGPTPSRSYLNFYRTKV
jgi:deoxycytidine triphosphate deaminase